jgi:hypothetical protein
MLQGRSPRQLLLLGARGEVVMDCSPLRRCFGDSCWNDVRVCVRACACVCACVTLQTPFPVAPEYSNNCTQVQTNFSPNDCCTALCEVLAVGTPQWSLLDPGNPRSGGLLVDFAPLPRPPSPNPQCDNVWAWACGLVVPVVLSELTVCYTVLCECAGLSSTCQILNCV